MNDVTVVTSVTYPSPESLALVADVQYHEPYLSAALNRKFRGIVDPGFYAGFLPKPGGGMNLLITSVDGDKTAGAASVDIGEFYQVTIQHRKDISLALNAGKKYAIVLKGRYLLGEDTYQVNTASHIHAAEFVARTYTDSYQLGDGELLVCTVNIPAGVSTITQEMIDTSERINRTIGIDISDSVTSTRSDVAASSLAVKKAYDLAKSKYTAQDASTTQKGLVQLSSETNSDSETMAATPKAVKSVKDLADTKAPIESPSLTGTPTAPTAAQGTNNTQIATTAYVRAAISALVGSSPEALDTLNELAEALGNDPNFATTMTNALAGKQPLDATLTALAGLPTGANKLPYFTGKDTVAQTDLTPVGRDILAKSSTQAIIQYLGLEETINRAADALQKSQNGADIPDKPRFVQNIGLKETLNPTKRVSIGNIGTGVFDGSTPCINIGDSDSGFIGSADGVLDIYCNAAKVGYIDGNGLHMLTDIHFDNARMTTNGDIFGSVWGNNWLSIWITNQLNTRGTIDWINSELAVRDNNINTRATWDYVNQTFARKNTGSIQDWGWILDDSTGFIMQWGTLGNSNGTYNFPRAFPVGCFAVFVTNTNAQGTQVDNAFGYPVSNSQFFAATKSSGMANLVNNFPVAWLALGR
ncbi:tail fiber protein [Salmonella enterica]|nr:tail fiber protein [Salmonella enterica]ECD8065478.1 phage tail protein [Salmonella enterica subsp. enterica serovar Typhimurium]ECI4889061.1 phage tail protein [Salmonella enterica subsp. enterica]EIT0822342.1 tail fiber protein [Salmonella enterica subsp. enterica serovar Derby]MCY5000771.1 tail fiber protein [Salmonella enterica subsp. enterica serovar 1,4,[5],12:i:-]EAA7789901.1 phage tail protein [Salmonella enterica]